MDGVSGEVLLRSCSLVLVSKLVSLFSVVLRRCNVLEKVPRKLMELEL